MVRHLLFLPLFIFIFISVSAQQSTGDDKPVAASSNNTIGFKKQSSVLPDAQKNTPSKSTPKSPVNNSKKTDSAPSAENAAKVSEMMKVDYAGMPAEVKSRINNNKQTGKKLFEGVLKAFTVQIKACVTDTDRKRILAFLDSKKGFNSSLFISEGLVKIIVEPLFDSPDLKEALSAQGIAFNFLNRSYQLKK